MGVSDERRAVLARLREELARRGAGGPTSLRAIGGAEPVGAVAAAVAGGAFVGGGAFGAGTAFGVGEAAGAQARGAVVAWEVLEGAMGVRPAGLLAAVCGVGRTRIAAGAGAVAWIDLERRLFPPAVARLGVDLTRLLWVRPRDVADALWAAHVLLAGGAFARVVVDLAERSGDRRVERSMLRLERDAERGGCNAFLLVAQPVAGAGLTLVCREEPGVLRVAWQLRRGPGRRHGQLALACPEAGVAIPGGLEAGRGSAAGP